MAGNRKYRKKRKREERPTTHRNNKYSDKPPDFALLASLYPSFEHFVFYSKDGRPRIDWTDFNATRELTRVLLLHDHGLKWWIPDGQLCPTVPNRSNYIHWVEDLLSSNIIPKGDPNEDKNVRGFDIGTGANCIYPLLGASLLGWSFVGSDVADVALEWAEKNVKDNPQVSEFIEVRRVEAGEDSHPVEDSQNIGSESKLECGDETGLDGKPHSDSDRKYYGPPVLVGVVRDGETFDFCMCNPPFFETMEEAGLNPKTACGGTPQEMVCPGGEKAFISRIIEDSVVLKQTFRWYTSMVGRKTNLKYLVSKLWEVGASVVKTTEFVQGHTSRWGLAWSFVPPITKTISLHVAEKSNSSFVLEGLQRQYNALNVLQSIESFFSISGASCNLNTSSFTVDVTASHAQRNVILKRDEIRCNRADVCEDTKEKSTSSCCLNSPINNLCFRVSVFQQIPGTLLVKSSLKPGDSQVSGTFSSMMKRLEEVLKQKFCREKSAVHPLK